jgi:tRNA(fMet)-specific endonuclease VapC
MPWLLDTNAWIDFFKSPNGLVANRLQQKPRAEIVTCSVVKAELFHGALKYGNPQRRAQLVRGALDLYVSYYFDDAAADQFAQIRHMLELAGQPIGPLDTMIAAICLVHDCTVVTSNTGEFARVPGLNVEDWSKP